MQAQLAKSLYLGLAALSLGAVATVTTTATTADAASKAKVVSKSSLGKDSKNVELTGANAIYSKPGTVKGAKTVASKKTVKKLASSTHSKDYFRAYYMAVTNRGTVYYKIVSMNGKYRGYIYGGKIKGTIGAGIKEAQTTKEATMPTRTAGFHIKDVKKNTLWTAPQHTTYKAHKVNMYGTTKEDTFTVSKAETKTKEGSLYYYVTSDNNSAVSGWIFAGEGYKDASNTDFGGLSVNKTEAEATNNNSVKIVYREAGKQVGEATWITTLADTKAGNTVNTKPEAAAATTKAEAGVTPTNAAMQTLSQFIVSKAPNNYQLDDNAITLANNATYGNSVYVNVKAGATSKIALRVTSVDNTLASVTSPLSVTDHGLGDALDIKDVALSISSEAVQALSGAKGEKISNKLGVISAGFSAKYQGTKTYYTSNGSKYHYEFTFDKAKFESYNQNMVFGETLQASFSAKLVVDAANNSTVDNSWVQN